MLGSRGGLLPLMRALAVLIDLMFTALVLWLAVIISQSVIRYIDTSIRFHILGQMVVLLPGNPPRVDLAIYRTQLAAHPLLTGRPLLSYRLSIVGDAAILILVQRFVRSICGQLTFGEYIVRPRGAAADSHAREIRDRTIAGVAAQARERLIDRFLGWLSIDAWREILDNVTSLWSPVKSLPRAYWAMGLASVVITIALSLATAVVLSPHSMLEKLAFIAPSGNTAYIARLSLYLGLAAIAVGWAIAISGASMVHPAVLLLIVLFYEYTVMSVGLSGGRAWFVVAPQWIMVIIAACAPAARTNRRFNIAVVWALVVIAVFHLFRLTPLALLKTGIWPALKSWPAIFAYASAMTALTTRVRLELSARLIFVITTILTAGYFAIALRVGEQQLAGSLYYSISALLDFLLLFWFLLGRNLVTPSIAAANQTVSLASWIFRPRRLPLILIVACLLELALIGILETLYPDIDIHSSKYIVGLPAHRGIALLILVISAILASIDALTPRRAMWLFVAWAFSLAMIVSYFGASLLILNAELASAVTVQFQAQLGDITRLSAILLLTLGILLELATGHRQIGSDAPSDASVGVLLTYLGVLALFSVLTHLMLVSQTYSPLFAAAYTFQGMSLMWPAIAVLAVMSSLRSVSDGGRTAMRRALLAGAFVSILPDLLRRAWGNSASIGITQQLIAMFTGELVIAAAVASIVAFYDQLNAADAICTGAACAFGFVVAYVGELAVPLLTMLLGAPAHMLGVGPLIKLTETWLTYLPYGDHGNPIPHAELVIFYVLAPALATLVALGIWSLRRGDRSPRVIILAAIASLVSMAYVIPLYGNSFMIASFGQDQHSAFSTGVAHDAYIKAILYLAPPVLAIAWFLRRQILTRQPSPAPLLPSTEIQTA
jgi:hypothetical protein